MSALDSLLPFGNQSKVNDNQQARPTVASALDSLMPFAPDLPAAAPDDGVPPSPVAQLPVDPIDAQIARNNAFKSEVDGILAPPPNAFEAANQATQQADTSNNIENAMAMQPAPSSMVAPMQLGRDGVNPVSVFNPLPVDNAEIVRDEISKIEQQPMATQERADAGLFNPNRDFGKAVEFGGLRAQSDTLNFTADAEDVLRQTAPMQMMQTIQNAALPVVNPIRELFGAAPLPENANEKASIAAAAAARQDATRLMDQAKALGYRQMTTDDIDNFGDFLDWAKTSLGASGEPMLVSLATGGWMSPLLMAGEYNTNLKEIKGLSKEKRLALASSGGLVAGFLENVGLGILIKGMPKELVGKLGGKWFVEKVSKHFGGRLAAALLTGMVSEGLVEVGQEGIGIGLEASVGKNFGKGEIWNRVKESGAAGAVLGGGIRVGVQSGTEAVSGVQSAITPDPLLSDNEKIVAEFIAIDTLNPANAQLTEVKPQSALDSLMPNVSIDQPAQAQAVEPAVEPVVEQPVVEQPVVEQPVVEQPVVEQPVVEQPVVEQVFTSKTVPQMIGGQPSTDPRETLTAISDGTNTRYITHVDDEGWVEVDEAGTELEKQPSFWMDSASQKKQAIEFMQEEMAAPAAETAPAVEPVAAEPAPAAEQVNPQAQPVIPFARPVADTDGQQKTVSIATPDNEVTVQAKPVILDAADLKAATGNLQPRDRSLNESAVEVQRRAANLDPARLLDSPTSDNGAPIVARDGTIISGNGRVLSLREVYKQFPEQAAAYKQAIAQYGTSDANYDNPVLVMMLDQDMSIEQLADFADRSNRSAIATMSATERAQRDAQAMDIGLVNMFKGGSINSIENQGFVQQFMRSVVAPTEQNTMSRNGRLTKEGFQRIQNAILATAYEDTDTLAIMLEESDEKIKNVSTALLDAAPSFAKLKSAIAAGEVDSQFDISASVTEAARIINDLRSQKPPVKPRDFFAQQNMFPNLDPNTEAIIRAFYNEELTRAKSQIIMADVLKFYTEEAAQKKQGGFFEDTTTPRDVIQLARRKADDTEGQGDLLSDTKQRTSRSLNESSQQTQRTAPKRSGQRATGGLAEAEPTKTESRVNVEREGRTRQDSETAVERTDTKTVSISKLENQKTDLPGTRLFKESLRENSALQKQAFKDAGLDPRKAGSLPIENQFRILAAMMVKKFGFAQVIKTDNANAKEAVDQLLVGYHNLTDLGYRLGLPSKAFGLDGTLSFVLANNIGALGKYDPNSKSIVLPKRSNSFAHEWFHAFDAYMLEKYTSGLQVERKPLMSTAVRKYGSEAFSDEAPTNVKDAYLALMRALYKDKVSEAMQLQAINEKMAAMQSRANSRGVDVGSMKSYQQLQSQKENILGSIGKSRKIRKTEYRDNAEFFGDFVYGNTNYWISPQEMSARAFEAFAIRQLTNAALSTAGMGKSDAAYRMTLEQLGLTKQMFEEGLATAAQANDARMALSFPKDSERVEIFGAFQNLMDAIAGDTELGQGNPSSQVGNEFVVDLRDNYGQVQTEVVGFIADQRQAQRRAAREVEKMEGRQDKYQNKYTGVKRKIYQIEDGVLSPLFYVKQTTLRTLLKRYPYNGKLKELYQQLGTHSGGQFQTTAEGDNLANATARQIRVFSQRMKDIDDKYGITDFNDLELDQLRTVLLGKEDLGSSSEAVLNAAEEIRDTYNMLYDYMRSAGIDLGYAPSGYVPRSLDVPEVMADREKFKTQAGEAYKIVWDQELGQLDNPDLDFMLDTIKFIQDAKLSIQERRSEDSDQRASLGNSKPYKDFVEGSKWTEIKQLQNDLRSVERLVKQGKASESEIDSIRQELELAVLAAQSEFSGFFSDMRDLFAQYRAINWDRSVVENHASGDITQGSPQSIFTKKRQLPPEADTLLESFYITDPIDNLTGYIMSTVKRTEYNRRFGKDKIPPPYSKDNYSDYLDFLIKTMNEDKLRPEDRLSIAEKELLSSTVKDILGRNFDAQANQGGARLANKLSALLSMTLLIRAPIAGIAEPFTVAMTSGSVAKGMSAFAKTLQEIPGLRKFSKNVEEDIRLRHQFARIMGVLDDPAISDVIMNRIGGDFAGDQNLQKFMSSFFQKIQLTGMTNAQRRAAAAVGFQFITELSFEIRNPSSERNSTRAKLMLNDLGVDNSRMDQFIDFILDYTEEKTNFLGKQKSKVTKLPEIKEVMDENLQFNDMGLQLAVSVMRFTDQSIQDPRVADRPKYAEYPVGRLVFGITSFIRSFHDKVLMNALRKVGREYRVSKGLGRSKKRAGFDAGTYAVARVGAPLFTLFMGHALVSTAREYLLNQDRWDREWEESEEDTVKFIQDYLFPLAFARAGLTGAFDPFYQAWTGLKYQRDLSNHLIGTAGYLTQNFEDALGIFQEDNSPNTVTAEFKAYRAFFNLTVAPGVSLVLGKTPMGSAARLPAYVAGASLTSTTAKNFMINRILQMTHGQTYEPGQRGRKAKSTFKP